jgi:peptidoglycan/LPS O-acetylase OafA/YrhL
VTDSQADRSIGGSFDPRHNSLNAIRLALAFVVLFSHAFDLGGYHLSISNPRWNPGVPATVAVYGFFGISGFLIARSASNNGSGRYLWMRFLRIFPAFWACLIATAGVFGLVAYLHSGGSIIPYVSGRKGPFSYVAGNASLWITQKSISGTPRGVMIPLEWNGSLWTLIYEFAFYLVLGLFAAVGLLRRRAAVLILTLAIWATEVVITTVPSLNARFNVFHLWVAKETITLGAIFLTGTLVHLYREKIPDSGVLAAGCAAAFLASFFLPFGSEVFAFRLTSVDVLAPVLIFPLIWLATHLPLDRVGSSNDYSYGVYLYAYPVSQWFAVWHVQRWGYWPYSVAIATVTSILAAVSWWGIEKHALRLKRFEMSIRRTPRRMRPAERHSGLPLSGR